MGTYEPDVRKLATRIIVQQFSDFDSLVREIVSPQGHLIVPESSPAHRYEDWLEKQRDDTLSALQGVGMRLVGHLAFAAKEHASGLEVLLRSPQLMPVPSMTIARSLVEVGVEICSLLDPCLSHEERTARLAAAFVFSVQGGVPTLQEGKATANAARVKSARDDAIDFMSAAGLAFKINSEGQAQNVQFESAKANITPKVTDLLRSYCPRVTAAYQIFSGATHARMWMLSGLEGEGPLILSSVILPLLDLVDSVTESLCGYCGVDESSYAKKTHLRRIAISRRLPDGERYEVGDWKHYRECQV